MILPLAASRTTTLLVFLGLAFGGGDAAAQAPSAESIARQYLKAQQASMQASAGEAELAQIAVLLADSVVYEHPRAGARIVGRASLVDGMRGFLGVTRNARVEVLDLFAGAGVIAVKQRVSFEIRRNGEWERNRRTQVTVYDIQGGRITRIVDFWQPG